MEFLAQFLTDENGTTSVEYAVLLALIIVTVIGAIGAVGTQTGGMWGGIDTDLNSHGFGASTTT